MNGHFCFVALCAAREIFLMVNSNKGQPSAQARSCLSAILKSSKVAIDVVLVQVVLSLGPFRGEQD